MADLFDPSVAVVVPPTTSQLPELITKRRNLEAEGWKLTGSSLMRKPGSRRVDAKKLKHIQ